MTCTHAVHKTPTDMHFISNRFLALHIMQVTAQGFTLPCMLYICYFVSHYSQHIILEWGGDGNLTFLSHFHFQQCFIFRIYFKFLHLLPENIWLLHIARNAATSSVESQNKSCLEHSAIQNNRILNAIF